MSKKPAVFLAALVILHVSLCADWRSEISLYFGENKDYRGAIEYLLSTFSKVDEIDKADVAGLLAYSYQMINDKNTEYEWLSKYFETYMGFNTSYYFLDNSSNAAISNYLFTWQTKFPLIAKIGFISRGKLENPTPPSQLVIGIVIVNSAFYKLSAEKETLKAGQFLRGFNSFTIETAKMFKEANPQLYFLDLKVDDFVLRKEIEINIQLKTPLTLQKPEQAVKEREYIVSMFAGDALLASSKKVTKDLIPMHIELPPQRGRFEPYGPVDPTGKEDPFSSSGSILSAIASIYHLIKELTKKNEEDEYTPPVEIVEHISLTFIRKNPEGVEEEVKALLTLSKRNIKFSSLTNS